MDKRELPQSFEEWWKLVLTAWGETEITDALRHDEYIARHAWFQARATYAQAARAKEPNGN